jgi:integrase
VEEGATSTIAKARARRQANALAELAVEDAEKRLVLDWTQPLRHATFYKAVYRPAVLRANMLNPTAKLSPAQSFHSLRHSYASLCLAAGIRPIDIAELMGHRDVKTTLTVYAHSDQHRRPHGQYGRARRVGDPSSDAELRQQRDPATRLKLFAG